uniref:Hypothetical chloroplast RF62 n=1 Tax=Marsupiomonas sp. NIES 1824 TaxID=1562198 RepID=A0A097KM00_9CHLO|nr:hypothetical chloroplast RF62 [Marsupiomonas sp. NIES 1824]
MAQPKLGCRLSEQFMDLFLQMFTKERKMGEKLIHSFSGGQDSLFLFLLLLHTRRQYQQDLIFCHQNHEIQSSNFYFEFHCFQIFVHFSIPSIIGVFVCSKSSEQKLKEFRYDLLLRGIVYYKFQNIYLSHSQTDLVESKFCEFFQKSLISMFEQTKQRISMNSYLFIWPISKKRKLQKKWMDRKNFFLCRSLMKESLVNEKQRKRRIPEGVFFVRPISSIPRFMITEINSRIHFPRQNDPTNFLTSHIHNNCRHQIIPLFRYLGGNTFDKNFYFRFHFKKTEKIEPSIVHHTYLGNHDRKKDHRFWISKRSYWEQLYILNLKKFRLQRMDSFFQTLLMLSSLYHISLSEREFSLISSLSHQDQVYLLRVRYPQVLVLEDFLILRL